MEKHHLLHAITFSLIASLGVVSFICCVIAEFKKSKKGDVRLIGKLCYLPGSDAFRFGIAGLVCLLSAELIGSFLVCRAILSAGRRPKSVILLLGVSWLASGVDLILLSTAASMNRRQPYGKGWLDGDCYVVKDGVFLSSALLVILILGCTLVPSAISVKQRYDHNTQGKTYPNGTKKDDGIPNMGE